MRVSIIFKLFIKDAYPFSSYEDAAINAAGLFENSQDGQNISFSVIRAELFYKGTVFTL
jgi:hypothetical protein